MPSEFHRGHLIFEILNDAWPENFNDVSSKRWVMDATHVHQTLYWCNKCIPKIFVKCSLRFVETMFERKYFLPSLAWFKRTFLLHQPFRSLCIWWSHICRSQEPEKAFGSWGGGQWPQPFDQSLGVRERFYSKKLYRFRWVLTFGWVRSRCGWSKKTYIHIICVDPRGSIDNGFVSQPNKKRNYTSIDPK